MIFADRDILFSGHIRFLLWTSVTDNFSLNSSDLSISGKDAEFLHADNEDSDQTSRIRSIIWVIVGRTCQKVRFLTLWLICFVRGLLSNKYYKNDDL